VRIGLAGRFFRSLAPAGMARGLRTRHPATKLFGAQALSLNGIMSSALTALQANQSALSVVSNNVSNVNTPGYARRTVDFQTLSAGGQLAGVDIASVQRVVDQFLNQEVLSAQSSSSLYGAQSDVYDQVNALLGSPGDGTSLSSQLTDVSTALGQAALSPTSSASQLGVLNSLQGLANTVSSLSSSLSNLQSQTDSQVASQIGSANDLIQQIYQLNSQIATADAGGDTSSALLDQRDEAVQNLSQLMDVRTTQMSNGTVAVMTTDGTSLVGNTYAQLSYSASDTPGVYQPVMLQNIDPATGQAIGQAQALDPHLSGGSLTGLIGMRDGPLADLQNELGSFAQGLAQSFNAQNNANAAFPPPTTLSGRDTGLLSSDALNFSGQTTIAITDDNGVKQHTIAVDFDAGTISVDGGAASSFTPTIGGFTSALNSALGANGSASFANGQLTISATGTNGVVIQDDASTPSSRGGMGFSQFFGLNDLFQSAGPSTYATGLSASDAAGLNNGGEIDLQLKGADGSIVKQASVAVTPSMTIGQVVSALNTAMGGTESFTLNSDGSITTAPSANYSGAQLQVTNDTTQRGTTGISFTDLFGGSNALAAQAQGFAVNPAIVSDPSRLAFATPDVSSDQVVGGGDSSGLQALQTLATATQNFAPAGDLGSQTCSLGDYAASFYQDIATLSSTATSNQTAQNDRLTEAQTRQSNESGVNLDEELSNMMIYQQAYSAGARMLTTADQLYQALLQIQ
jgi:flagellar hook-associated protein 1 FlgK